MIQCYIFAYNLDIRHILYIGIEYNLQIIQNKDNVCSHEYLFYLERFYMNDMLIEGKTRPTVQPKWPKMTQCYIFSCTSYVLDMESGQIVQTVGVELLYTFIEMCTIWNVFINRTAKDMQLKKDKNDLVLNICL